MNKKIFLFIAVVVFAVMLISGWMSSLKDKPTEVTSAGVAETAVGTDTRSFMLSGYPEIVPLVGLDEISSMKFFVNDDDSSRYLFGGPVNYYNVVYSTSLSRSQVFAGFRKDMIVDEEESSESKLFGTIGEYSVSVSQYEEDGDTVYLQVALPLETYKKMNPYFTEYPEVVEIDDAWVEKESSYGLLNQKGGEVEYWQYFVLNAEKLSADMSDQPLTDFYQLYSEKYQAESNFEADDATQKLSWTVGECSVTLTFSNDHGRVYLMVRNSL